jgi:hypothetical protein
MEQLIPQTKHPITVPTEPLCYSNISLQLHIGHCGLVGTSRNIRGRLLAR